MQAQARLNTGPLKKYMIKSSSKNWKNIYPDTKNWGFVEEVYLVLLIFAAIIMAIIMDDSGRKLGILYHNKSWAFLYVIL